MQSVRGTVFMVGKSLDFCKALRQFHYYSLKRFTKSFLCYNLKFGKKCMKALTQPPC